MGNVDSKPSERANEKYLQECEEVTEFLDEHPLFLSDYIDRRHYLLDNYVTENVDEDQVREWLEKLSGPSPVTPTTTTPTVETTTPVPVTPTTTTPIVETTTPVPADVLRIGKIDLLKEVNTKDHRTDLYVNNGLILRRGQTFQVALKFKNREYLPARDKVYIEVAIGTKPSAATNTLMRMLCDVTIQPGKWGALLQNTEGEFCVKVNIPADAIIGKYKLTVEVQSETEEGVKTERKAAPDIIVIFNPFCKDDEVYLEDQSEQNEYVLNDEGIIYSGSSNWRRGMHWLFGQFEEGILSIALKLLREEPMAKKNPLKSLKKRSSAAQCTRILSAMVNCNDDDGVVLGNWSGDYSGGASPTSWSGSVKILKDWNSSKMQPVKYGQCWVFAGVFNTVLRALGIPSRVVTNYNSAHDTEYNMVIDMFINEDGVEDDRYSADSIWNFHVWNEAWFKRPDLPKGYDGWQVVDATPQEESGGIMRLGPAPVKAVKNGEIYIGQDTNFVFAEVNADRVFWKINKESEVTGMVKRETRYIGKSISTKAVGSDQREDITDQYKYPEGSEEERATFEKAYAHGRKADFHGEFVIQDEGAITIDINSEDVTNGNEVSADIKVANTTGVVKHVTINTVVCSMLNNDERKAVLKTVKKTATLNAGAGDYDTIKMKFEEYGSCLGDSNVIRFTTTVRVQETGNLYVDRVDLRLESPDCMEIQCEDVMKRNTFHYVKLSITNPLSIPITGGVVTLQGTGIRVYSPESISLSDPIAPGATVITPAFEVRPWREGSCTLVADFDSNQITNIKARKRQQVAGRVW